MPIYEYVCRQCGHELEVLQKMSDPLLTQCPACGEPELSKKISAAGFRLAGSGWYETDFKGAGKKNLKAGDDSASTTKTADGGTGSGAETKKSTESAAKPAAKPTAKPTTGND